MRLSAASSPIQPFTSGFQHRDSLGTLNMNFGLVLSAVLYLIKKLTHSEQCHITKTCLSLKQTQARKQVQVFPCWRGSWDSYRGMAGITSLEQPGPEELLPQQAEVKRWSFVLHPDLRLSVLMSPLLSLIIPLLCHFALTFCFYPFFSMLPSLVALNSSSFLGGKGSDPPAPPSTQSPQAGLIAFSSRQGVKWDSRSCLWLHPQWDVGIEQGNGSQAEQGQDFSALSSLLFLGSPRLPWCCLGSLAKSLQHCSVSQKDSFNVFQNASRPFSQIPAILWGYCLNQSLI